jgi:hypothetical protein
MSVYQYASLFSLTLAIGLWSMGCNNSPPPGGAATGDKAGEHDHADHDHGDHDHAGHDHAGHDHDHGHEGPHQGHLLEPDTEGYHFEWTHTEDGKVTVYVLDGTAKKDRPIKASEIAIDVKIGEKVQTFKLPAADVSEADQMAAKFEITDKQLLGVLEALDPKGEGVTATVIANVEGLDKPVTAKIEADSHEHEHKH